MAYPSINRFHLARRTGNTEATHGSSASGGRVVAASARSRDAPFLTPVDESNRRFRFLAEATTLLASSLDYESTLQTLAALVVPALADWCSISVVEPGGSIRRIAVTCADPGKAALADELCSGFPTDATAPTGVAEVIRTGASQLYPTVPDELLVRTAHNEQYLQLLRALGFRSAMIVPLVARELVLGAITFVAAESGRVFGDADLAFCEDLAGRAALAVDNARLHAKAVQASRRFEELIQGLDAIVWERAPASPTFSFVNQRAVELTGYPLERWLEEPNFWMSIVHSDDSSRIERQVRGMLGGGRDHELDYRIVLADGEVRWVRDLVYVDRDERGTAVLLRGVCIDVTEQHRREQELRLQAALLEAQSEAGVEGMLVVSPEGRMISMNNRFREIWRLPQSVIETRDDNVALAAAMELVEDPDGFISAVRRIYETRERARRDEVRLRDGRVIDRWAAPLEGPDGAYLGFAWYFRDVTEEKRIERDLRTLASTLQASLLPPRPPAIPGLDVAARYRPARGPLPLGGDFYDVFRLQDDDWGVVIGDVCGKGPEAAALTALTRYSLRAAAVHHQRPSAVLRELNDALLADVEIGERYATVAYCRVERSATGARVELARGGHPGPLVVRRTGAVEEYTPAGRGVGLFEDAEFVDDVVTLQAGDGLVLVTDGVTEARSPDGALFSDGAFEQTLVRLAGRRSEEVARAVEEAAVAFAGGDSRDDLAVVVLRVPC